MQLIKNLLFAFLGWLILIVSYGYTLGMEDQQELLPYVLYLKNNLLYSKDFFIQNLSTIVPNERYFFAVILTPFIPYFDWLLLVLHAIFTVILLCGMYQIARIFIQSSTLSWLCVYCSLIGFYLYTLGGCDLYYNTFQSSNVAKAVGIWAIYYFLKERYTICFLLLSAITYIQIIVGLDTCIILLSILVLQKKYKLFFTQSFFYLLFTGFYLISIVIARLNHYEYDADAYFNILIEFRHPHHFYFSFFGLKHILLFTVLTFLIIYSFKKINESIYYFTLVTSIGFFIYYLATELFHFMPIVNFNFYKMSIWVKFFGFIVLFILLENKLDKARLFRNLETKFIWILILIPVLLFSITNQDIFKLSNKQLMIGKAIYQDPLVDISIKAKNILPKDALFIVPFDATGFKYWSQLNSYVDFKANTRTPSFMFEWYHRVGQLFNISLLNKERGFQLRNIAALNYNKLNASSLKPFIDGGVQYILTEKISAKIDVFEPPILENDKYRIYKLY